MIGSGLVQRCRVCNRYLTVSLVLLALVPLTVGSGEMPLSYHLIGPGTWGTMYNVGFHPTDPNVFITGVDMGLAFATNDGGTTWSPLGTLPAGSPSGYPGDHGFQAALFDPYNPGIRWVAGTMGLYKTLDAGSSWQLSFGGGEEYSPYALALDSTDSNIVYAGGGGPLRWFKSWVVEGKAIRKTTNGGATWQTIYVDPTDAAATTQVNWFKILIDTNSTFSVGSGHQRIYALKHPSSNMPGLYRSEDGGSSWTLLRVGDAGLSSVKVTDFTLLRGPDQSLLYATISFLSNGRLQAAVYRSQDQGSTWERKDTGLGLTSVEYPLIASCDSDPNTLYWHPGLSDRVVYKSQDQGASWRPVLSNSGTWSKFKDFDGLQKDILLLQNTGNWTNTVSGLVEWPNVLSCSPIDPNIVLLSHSDGIFITRDGGTSWQDLMFEYGDRSASYDNAVAAYGSGRPPSLYTHKRRSTGGQQVVPTVVTVDPFDSGNVAIGYDDIGLYISRDGIPAKDEGTWWEWAYWGMLWKDKYETRAIVYDPRVRNRMYVGTMGNVYTSDFQVGKESLWKLYRSDDGGVTFTHIGPDTSRVVQDLINAGVASKFSFGIRSIAIDPVDSNVIYAATPGNMYKTTDGGTNWTEVFGSPYVATAQLAPEIDRHHFVIRINPADRTQIYVGTPAGLFRSRDAAATWERINAAAFGTVRSLSICEADPRVMTVVASDVGYAHSASDKSELYISSDGGTTWAKQPGSRRVQCATVHPRNPDIIYRALYASHVLTEPQGLYRSTDRGANWTLISAGVPLSYKGYYKYHGDIAVDPNTPNRLYIPTYCGVWTVIDTQVPISPPVANPDTYTTDEDTTLVTASPGVLANDTNPENTTLTAVLDSGPAHGTLTLNSSGGFTYTPSANFNGTDTFTYHANNGGASSNGATVTITVNAVNDPPAAANDSYATNQNTTLAIASPGVLGNDTDVEGSALTAVLVAAPTNGTFTLNSDGSFSYTPSTGFTGADSFTYRANDGSANSDIATATITVSAVNRAPVAANDSYPTNEDAVLNVASPGVLGNDTDQDNDTLTAILDGAPTHGTLTLNSNGSFSYTPSPNFNGSDSFSYHARDGSANSNVATVTITIIAVNDPPVAANDSYSTNEDTALTVVAPGVLGNDTDPDSNLLTAILSGAPTHGTVTLNSDGSFSYTPAPNYNGLDSFTYTAYDGSLSSSVAMVSITISPVNDPPVAVNDAYSMVQYTTLAVSAPGILGNDTDVEGNSLTAVLVASTSNGSLTLNGNGGFSYTPNTGFTGTDSFTYRANDGSAPSNIATVTITVQLSANQPPIVNAGPDQAVVYPKSVTLNGSASDNTLPNGPLRITWSRVSGPGTATFSSPNTAVTSATFSKTGIYTLRLTASDGALQSSDDVVVNVKKK